MELDFRAMNITVTPALLVDCEGIAKLEIECFQEPWSLQQITESITQTREVNANCYYQFMIAKSDDEVLGYAGAQIVMGEADITNVAVTGLVRGLGIGSMLMEEMLKGLREQGVFAVNLEVRASNMAAIHLYQKYGFLENGIRKGFYRFPTEDAILMRLDMK